MWASGLPMLELRVSRCTILAIGVEWSHGRLGKCQERFKLLDEVCMSLEVGVVSRKYTLGPRKSVTYTKSHPDLADRIDRQGRAYLTRPRCMPTNTVG